jgi:CheY-like chemotaxis protein
LPRALLESLPAASPSPAPVTAIALDQAGPVIMVVDDNQVNIDTLGDFLEINQYRVETAHSGREFLERAPEVRPALVLMDIQMPGMDGLEATQHLRRHYDAKLAKVPIIALTALAMPGDRERCLAAGANEYMSKPMSLTELLATIARLIAAGA